MEGASDGRIGVAVEVPAPARGRIPGTHATAIPVRAPHMCRYLRWRPAPCGAASIIFIKIGPFLKNICAYLRTAARGGCARASGASGVLV